MGHITVINVTQDLYTQVPRTSHRPGPHKAPSLRALGLLTVLLSNTEEFETSTEQIARGWAEGRDAVRKAMDELEAAGYVVRRRVQVERGRWTTMTWVCAFPAQLDQYRTTDAGSTEDGFSGVGPTRANTKEPQVAPKTGFPASVNQASSKKSNQESIKESKKNPSPPPTATHPRASAGPVEEEEKISSKTKDTSDAADVLTQLVADALDAHPGWDREVCCSVLLDELSAGTDPQLLAAAWEIFLADKSTWSPKRFPHRVPAATWWADAEARLVEQRPAPVKCPTCAPFQRGFIYIDGDPDRLKKCPDCRPLAAVS